MRERHEKLLLISEYQLIACLTGAARITNMPEGAVCVGAYYDFPRKGFLVAVEHESFPPVPRGCEAPMMFVEFSEGEAP